MEAPVVLTFKTIHRGPEQSVVLHYQARNEQNTGECVLKRWPASRLNRGDNIAQPFAELRMLPWLCQHPSFVVPLDARINDTGLEVYYQYAGESVQHWQQYAVREGLDVTELALHVGLHLLLALRELRRQGIVHRDIKPSNVLMDGWLGPVRLADFGLATLEHSKAAFVAGTDYAAVPVEYAQRDASGGFSNLRDEVACRACTTCAIDMYQLGLLLFVLLNGALPPQLDPCRLSVRSPAALESLLDRVAAFNWQPHLDRTIGCPEAREVLEACLCAAPEQRPTPQQALQDFTWFRDLVSAAEQQLEGSSSAWAQQRRAAALCSCYVMASGVQRDAEAIAAELTAAQAVVAAGSVAGIGSVQQVAATADDAWGAVEPPQDQQQQRPPQQEQEQHGAAGAASDTW